MYKIVYNNIIIDAVEKIKYIRYIPEINKIIPADCASAHGIAGSSPRTYYHLEGYKTPPNKNWKTVSYFEIDEKEYIKILNSLSKNFKLYNNLAELNVVRELKLKELTTECNRLITEGIYVKLEDGYYYSFELTTEDQLNIIRLSEVIRNGAKKVIYHFKNGVCKVYSKTDFLTIFDAYNKHINKHTTYFNLLKYCINNIYDIEYIGNIKYGDDLLNLPVQEDIKKEVQELLNNG